MNQNQSLVKREKLDSDLLSDLPLGIINSILALIPIREAVRTCILSNNWRYIWTSLPQLAFTDNCAGTEDTSKYRYEDFITRVLFRHNGPIYKFEISCSFRYPIPIFDEWIYFLSRHGVKEIILNMDHEITSALQPIRSSIYSCRDLTNLEVWNCVLDPLPLNFKGFFSLKCLKLNRIGLSRNGIESLISICPLLERLTLIEIECIQAQLNISAPNLKYLEFSGEFVKLCLCAPLLSEMSVEMCIDDLIFEEQQQQKTSVCNYMSLLGGLTDLQKLEGTCDFSKYLSIGIESCHSFLVFHHLMVIELCFVNFEDANERKLVSRLLIGAPSLHKLQIMCAESVTQSCDASDLHSSFGFLPSFKLEKLRVFIMQEVTGLPMEMAFIKILLESSPVLEMVNVDGLYGIDSEEKKKSRDELMGCSCASPIVKLTLC